MDFFTEPKLTSKEVSALTRMDREWFREELIKIGYNVLPMAPTGS